jgi:hypothetical protein
VEVPHFGEKPESDSGFDLHLLVDLPFRGSVLFGVDLKSNQAVGHNRHTLTLVRRWV